MELHTICQGVRALPAATVLSDPGLDCEQHLDKPGCQSKARVAKTEVIQSQISGCN